MPQLLPILVASVSLCIVVITLELIRRAQLRAQHALLWLLSTGIILIISLSGKFLDSLAALLGIGNARWLLLFLIGFLLALIIQGSQTITISKLTRDNRDLAQRIAILDWYVSRLREQAHQQSVGSIQSLQESQESIKETVLEGKPKE